MAERPSRLVLASASPCRRDMLEAAGLSFEVVPAEVDEAAIEARSAPAEIDAAGIARGAGRGQGRGRQRSDCPRPSSSAPTRFSRWARRCSTSRAIVPQARDNSAPAREDRTICTRRLRWRVGGKACGPCGNGHAYDAAVLGRVPDRLSGARPATASATAVGAYQIEGPGIQLFERIEGDYFTILGLPLLALLAELRARGVIAA